MSSDNKTKAYVQGDWVANVNAASAPGVQEPILHNQALQADYTTFVETLKRSGIENVATWHVEKSTANDAERNLEQLSEADVLISRFVRQNPQSRHWGSLAMIAAAAMANKTCFVLCAEDNVALKHFIVKHPLVRVFHDEAALLQALLQQTSKKNENPKFNLK